MGSHSLQVLGPTVLAEVPKSADCSPAVSEEGSLVTWRPPDPLLQARPR